MDHIGEDQPQLHPVYEDVVCEWTPGTPRHDHQFIFKLADGRLLLVWCEYYTDVPRYVDREPTDEAGGFGDSMLFRIAGKVSKDDGRIWSHLNHLPPVEIGRDHVRERIDPDDVVAPIRQFVQKRWASRRTRFPGYRRSIHELSHIVLPRCVASQLCRLLEAVEILQSQDGYYTAVIEVCFDANERSIEAYPLSMTNDTLEDFQDYHLSYERAHQIGLFERETAEEMKNLYSRREGKDLYSPRGVFTGMSGNATDAELEKTKCFVDDAISNTLACDHQSRGMYFEGEHERTYVAYMDDDFYARITYYDHDDENWVHPVLVDDCIGPDRLKDGHNVPNLFVTDDGTIHLLYGSHGHVFKHAYSESREQIEEWKTGMRFGEHGTYPYFARIDDGQYLLFYRYGPEGGYNNPFLAVHESTDHGRTWSERSKLVSWPTGCKISQVVYDPVKDLVHLMLLMPGSEKTADLSPYLTGEWRIFHCRYDPRSETVSAIDGSELGPLATEEEFVTSQAVVSYEQFGAVVLHKGDPYFVLCDGDGRIYFGFWNGQELKKRFLPEESVADLSRSTPVVYTEDGSSFRVYGLTEPRSEEYHGGSLVCLMTPDCGERWEGPERIVDHRKLGHGLASINEVMNYSGEGPFLLVNEPTGSFPQDWRKNKYTHYDNPSRRDKKIYAVDFEGEFIERKFAPGYFREDPYDGWSRQFQ